MSLDVQLSFHDGVSPLLRDRYRSIIRRQELTARGLEEVTATIQEASLKRYASAHSPNPLKLRLTLGFNHTEAKIAYSRPESIEQLLELYGADKIEQLQGTKIKVYLKSQGVIALGKYN